MPDPFAIDKASTAVLSMDFQNEIVEMLPEPARAVLDNAYFLNNQRVEIAESHSGDFTLDDLLTNRPGGIVRTFIRAWRRLRANRL